MWPRQINYGLPADFFVVNEPHSIAGGVSNSATALGVGVGVGVIPLLAAAPCVGFEDDRGRIAGNAGNIQFWQKPDIADHGFLHTSSGGGVGGGAMSAAMTCQDCGNQAKKDCSHRRCRTCCKSRGFDCATHLRSTWVPAARRRERQLMGASTAGASGSSASTSGTKKARLTSQTTTTSHTSTSNTTPRRSFETSSSHQGASFKGSLPAQVRAPAVFKCVRVTSVDEGDDDEFAYQAVVKIGGHVFKGFLYDQGVEQREAFPNMSELHLGGGSSAVGGGSGSAAGRNLGSSSSPLLHPSEVYGSSGGGGILGGSSYGNLIN